MLRRRLLLCLFLFMVIGLLAAQSLTDEHTESTRHTLQKRIDPGLVHLGLLTSGVVTVVAGYLSVPTLGPFGFAICLLGVSLIGSAEHMAVQARRKNGQEIPKLRIRALKSNSPQLAFNQRMIKTAERYAAMGPEGIRILLDRGTDFVKQESRRGGMFSAGRQPPSWWIALVADVEEYTLKHPSQGSIGTPIYNAQAELPPHVIQMVRAQVGSTWDKFA